MSPGYAHGENPETKQRRNRVTRGDGAKGYLTARRELYPMHFARRDIRGGSASVWEPLIHNLLFIRRRPAPAEIKACTTLPDPLHHGPGNKSPTVIPERQMQDFHGGRRHGTSVEIVAPQDVKSGKRRSGTRDRRVFAGIEGRYIRHKGTASPWRIKDRHRTDGLYAAEIYRKNSPADPSSHTYAIRQR